jgi:hypothetical protein
MEWGVSIRHRRSDEILVPNWICVHRCRALFAFPDVPSEGNSGSNRIVHRICSTRGLLVAVSELVRDTGNIQGAVVVLCTSHRRSHEDSCSGRAPKICRIVARIIFHIHRWLSGLGKLCDPRLSQGRLPLLRENETWQVHERAGRHKGR